MGSETVESHLTRESMGREDVHEGGDTKECKHESALDHSSDPFLFGP